MIHYPQDTLRLDFTDAERQALITLLIKRSAFARGAREQTVDPKSRLIGYYKLDEARAERLKAQLEEPGTEVMTADDIRYLRHVSLSCPVALNAANRIWQTEGVRRK